MAPASFRPAAAGGRNIAIGSDEGVFGTPPAKGADSTRRGLLHSRAAFGIGLRTAAAQASAFLGCGCSSGVEHNLAKVGVEGSNPFARSRKSPDRRSDCCLDCSACQALRDLGRPASLTTSFQALVASTALRRRSGRRPLSRVCLYGRSAHRLGLPSRPRARPNRHSNPPSKQKARGERGLLNLIEAGHHPRPLRPKEAREASRVRRAWGRRGRYAPIRSTIATTSR